MGFDVTYHAFSPADMQDIFFAPLEKPELSSEIVAAYHIEDFNAKKLEEAYQEARKSLPPKADADFANGPGFLLAVAAGIVREYDYARGAAFSFCVGKNPAFVEYISDWRELVPESWRAMTFPNRITENYCLGVYLQPEALRRFHSDYQTRADIKATFDEVFGANTDSVFWRAVEDALASDRGLIEAADIIEPHPFNLADSKGYADFHRCRPEGLELYASTAQAQLASVAQEKGWNVRAPIQQEVIRVPTAEAEKLGFVDKLRRWLGRH